VRGGNQCPGPLVKEREERHANNERSRPWLRFDEQRKEARDCQQGGKGGTCDGHSPHLDQSRSSGCRAQGRRDQPSASKANRSSLNESSVLRGESLSNQDPHHSGTGYSGPPLSASVIQKRSSPDLVEPQTSEAATSSFSLSTGPSSHPSRMINRERDRSLFQIGVRD